MVSFHRRAKGCSRAWLLVSAWLVNWTWAADAPAKKIMGPTLQFEVDARDLPARLLHAQIRVPCRPGNLALWFPKWVPGAHGPFGPIQDVGGLRLETAAGETVGWHRDESETCRIECNVPAGVDEIVVRLDAICNQASVHNLAFLSYGNSSVGIINWGTCLVSPWTQENAKQRRVHSRKVGLLR